MTDTERERHIADCGKLMQAAMARYQQSSDLADLGDAHRWRRLMEEAILRAVQRKQKDHESMKVHMQEAMRRAVEIRGVKLNYQPTLSANLPAWLTQA